MAEMITNSNGKGHNRGNRSTRVDLTPMVDLGFLLITFFIFTTTISNPTAMKMNLPADNVDNNPPEAGAEKTLQIVLEGNNQVSYFTGDDSLHKQTVGYDAGTGLRHIIQEKQRQVAAKYGKADEIVVLIKPTDQSTYRNVVDAMDEMLINNITRYMLL